ncbi:hypothetical protein AZE42_13433, partial [Rhizopogon vesiculosus]
MSCLRMQGSLTVI